jgi:hypothetical protein
MSLKMLVSAKSTGNDGHQNPALAYDRERQKVACLLY